MRRLIPFAKSSKPAKRAANASIWHQIKWRIVAKRGAVLALLSVPVGLWVQSEIVTNAFYDFSAEQGYALSELQITGRNFTQTNQILSAINADYGTALLSLNVHDIQAKLNQLGWVKSATVTRHYPDALSIAIVEKRPMALLQTKAGHRLIDYDGEIIFSANASDFAHLPVVAGEGAASTAGIIIDALKTEPELFADVWAIHRVSDRRWDVHLRSGMAVKLPETDAILAWSKLAVLDRDTQIMARDLASIDLRVPGQLIVEPNLPIAKKGRKT